MSSARTTIQDVAGEPIGRIVTVRGRELSVEATVADARELFASSSSVRLVPLLDGQRYAGAVARDDLVGAGDDEPVARHARSRPPTAAASTSAGEALDALAAAGGRRLVVLGDDASSYVGIVCLTRDGAGLCIDADCERPPGP